MDCPVCHPATPLTPEPLEPHLTAWECAQCSGHWIRLADYWRWRAQAKVESRGTPEELVVAAGEVLHIPSNLPHKAEALEDTLDVDVFSPPRQDWLDKSDAYLRQK